VRGRPVLHTKQVRELRTFEALAPLIGWKIEPGSILQPEPPEPDIFCKVVDLGPIAIELLSLDDEYTNRQLRKDTRNAYITANFAEDLDTRGRAGSIEEVQAAITKHLPGSQFRRVHVFHLGFLKHVCSMPP
jgi:hypothetical protein